MIVKQNFINEKEISDIIQYSDSICPKYEIENEHIRTVNDATNGWSILHDLTKTPESKNISSFQGDGTQVDNIPGIFKELADRISESLNINKDHTFFQLIMLGENGKVSSHYDVGLPGLITYKCNICVEGPETDCIYVDKNRLEIKRSDLYCFEANFFKHWMPKSEARRIHLSYGFLLPYTDLGWNDDSSRVKLSNKIWKIFVNKDYQ